MERWRTRVRCEQCLSPDVTRCVRCLMLVLLAAVVLAVAATTSCRSLVGRPSEGCRRPFGVRWSRAATAEDNDEPTMRKDGKGAGRQGGSEAGTHRHTDTERERAKQQQQQGQRRVPFYILASVFRRSFVVFEEFFVVVVRADATRLRYNTRQDNSIEAAELVHGEMTMDGWVGLGRRARGQWSIESARRNRAEGGGVGVG